MNTVRTLNRPDSLALGARRFKRFTSADGNVAGEFFAVKALSDCVLHENIRFAAAFDGDTNDASGITNTDELAQGDVLYGPFDRVRLTSGTAVAYYTHRP